MAFWSAISLLWFKVPGLLSKSVIRGKKSKINRSIRQKMAEFYHEVLWQGVGELSEPYLLWNNSVPLDLASSPPTATENNFDYSRKEYLPFGMQHPRLSLGLCGLVQETLAAPIGGDSPDLPARFILNKRPCACLIKAINSHVSTFERDCCTLFFMWKNVKHS